MRHLYRREVLTTLIVGVLIVSGCSLTQPSRFYTLSSLSDAGAAKTEAQTDLAVGVGPISLPNYTDRPEVVTRASPNEFYFAEFDRWAEPQIERFALGFILMLIVALVPIWLWRNVSALAFGLSVLLLLFVEFFGVVGMGAQRWIHLRFMRM